MKKITYRIFALFIVFDFGAPLSPHDSIKTQEDTSCIGVYVFAYYVSVSYQYGTICVFSLELKLWTLVLFWEDILTLCLNIFVLLRSWKS